MTTRAEELKAALKTYQGDAAGKISSDQAESIFRSMVNDVLSGKVSQRDFADIVAQWYYFDEYLKVVKVENRPLSWLMDSAADFGSAGEEKDSLLVDLLTMFVEEPNKYYSWWDKQFSSKKD